MPLPPAPPPRPPPTTYKELEERREDEEDEANAARLLLKERLGHMKLDTDAHNTHFYECASDDALGM